MHRAWGLPYTRKPGLKCAISKLPSHKFEDDARLPWASQLTLHLCGYPDLLCIFSQFVHVAWLSGIHSWLLLIILIIWWLSVSIHFFFSIAQVVHAYFLGHLYIGFLSWSIFQKVAFWIIIFRWQVGVDILFFSRGYFLFLVLLWLYYFSCSCFISLLFLLFFSIKPLGFSYFYQFSLSWCKIPNWCI